MEEKAAVLNVAFETLKKELQKDRLSPANISATCEAIKVLDASWKN